MHTVYCIIGRSGSGKSTIAHKVAKALSMNILKSYTTRERRQNETEENEDHIFISNKDVHKFKNDMIAYTERVNYCSFATLEQLMNSDIFIINPEGYVDLIRKLANTDIKLVCVYVVSPYSQIKRRISARGNSEEWEKNYNREREEFQKFNKTSLMDYVLINDGDIENIVHRFIDIVVERSDKNSRLY